MTTFSTFATATFATGNIVVVQSAENMIPGLPISFTGNTFGNVTANATFYIGNITFGFPTSNITLTSLPGGAVYALANGSGNMMATFSQGGQQIIPTVAPGEPLNQAFDAVNVNFDQIFAAGPVGSNIQIDQNTILTLNTNGNLVLNPNGIGNVIANAHVIPDQDRVRNLGAFALRWNTVYAQNFVGNGGGISNITVSNISNGSTNITALANANITVTVAGTANVAVFTPDGLLINGTVTSTGNIVAPTFIGNLVGNITGNIDAGGANTQVQFNDNDLLAGSPGFTFNKTTNAVGIAGTVTAGNMVTGGTISAVGNISANYYFGNGSQLTGITADNVNADDLTGNTLSGNVIFSSLTTLGNLVSLSVTGTATTGNLATTGSVSATGNVTGNYILGNGALLTGVITSVANINNGNSNVTISGPGSNVTVGVGGTSNVMVVSPTDVTITGNLTVTGNATLSGNILGDRIQNGNTQIDIQTTGGNANVTVGGISNVAVFATTGVFVTGVNSVSGNITGGNIATGGTVSAVGNITGNYFIGNGSQLTGITADNVNADDLIGNTLSGNVLFSSLTTVGNLVNLSVVGTTTTGNLAIAGSVSATGNIISNSNVAGGNLLTGGTVSATGNVTGNYFIGNGAFLTGIDTTLISNGNTNVQTYANGNVSVTVAGVANTVVFTTTGVGIAGNVSAAGNVTGANVNTTTVWSSSDLNLQPVGNIALGNRYITGVRYPSADQDAASKIYVDNLVSTAISYHEAVAAATTSTLATATGGTVTYNQPGGAGNGIGATLTTTGSFNLIDTANVQTANTRILVKNEANGAHNGIYVWSNATAITRSSDADTAGVGNASALGLNDYFFVQTGNVNQGSAWIVDAPTSNIVFGTSNIEFAQFSQSQVYTANTSAGLSLAGTVFSAKVDNNTTAFDGGGNISVKAGANLTTPNIGAATGTSLSVSGNIVVGDKIIPATGNVNVANVNINNVVDPVQAQDAATKFYVDSAVGSASGNVLGNLINMGSNTQGQLISNAVSLTTSTKVTDGIALLNQVLGKLVPPAPPAFPAGQSIAISSISTYRMANITQVNNTANSLTVAAGATVTTVRRAATYATNTITTAGPGDAGTITTYRNGVAVGNVTLNPAATPSANGTYGGGNLIISNNFDYNSANANIAAGFWYVFSASISGSSAPAGWNDIVIFDTSAGNTNIASWYYDASSPSTPSYSSNTMTPPGSSTLLYSSTIPHYTNVNQFTIGTTVANVSGNLYPTSNVMATGTAAGSFAAPASVTYAQSNLGTNVIASFATASFTTTANVTTGFGGSSTGPSISVNNSYSTGTLTLTTALGNTVLYKSGTATAIDEGNIVVTTVGTGSGNAVRIVNPGTGNTPAYTANAAAFNSQSSTLQTYDATVVGVGSQGVLKHDQTNYSTGYLPVGPDLSAGRSGTQYFTFKFVRTDVSKFDITYAGNVAGMWVALPGSVIDSSSGANGWINMAVAYAGAGYPGVNSPGNGSDGCALGGTVSLNTTVASTSKTCTFGTVSSSSTVTNEIYVRIALTSGQTVTGLSLKAASN
jgi:hypothetical protein